VTDLCASLRPKLGRLELQSTAVDLAEAARRVYDAWDQVDGMDEELGAGGICQDVASAMGDVLSARGFEVVTVHASVGENHVYLVALTDDGVYSVDIPPHVYEIGSGYVWQKREDAVFDPAVVDFMRLEDPMSPDEFEARYQD